MVSTNILQRTFCIKYNEKIGTCFTIDDNGKQYIVTAKHLVEGIADSGTILIFHENQWKELIIKVVGYTPSPVDVAVLSPPMQISPSHHLPADAGNIYLSQDIYFLGFPYGLKIEVGPELNRDFPLPLVKKGIISSMAFNQEYLDYFLLDGHNNPGFSGGPVVAYELDKKELKAIGIISGYRYEWSDVFVQGQPVSLKYKENTGIIVAYCIRHATELIKINPIGFNL